VDAAARLDHRALLIKPRLAADVASQIRDSRSKHIRRDSLSLILCFAHGPPITRVLVPSPAARNLHALGAIHPA
jgi:hypothetical protein